MFCIFLSNFFNIMKLFTTLNKHLFFHRLDISLQAGKNTSFDAWIGAVLRNNLLFAAQQIFMNEKNATLYEYCNTLPLSENHPLYKELKDGFPSPYYLYVHNNEKISIDNISENEIIIFSLILIGELASSFNSFIESIQFMCNKGIGMYSKPFNLIDIREISAMNENQLLVSGNKTISEKLLYPFTLSLFEDQLEIKSNRICIFFESPMCLIKPKKKAGIIGYQEKANFFPSFYQLVRSAAYRLEKLHALYAFPENIENYIRSEESIESFIEEAASVLLEEVEIKKVHLMSSRRKNKNDNRIPLTGYVGKMVYTGDFKKYLPLLKMMEFLGVGHDLSYGFGKIKVEI